MKIKLFIIIIMKNFDKYKLNQEEWNLLLTLPLYFTTGIVWADEISNPEEYRPFWRWLAGTASSGNQIENDIAINLQDMSDSGVNIFDFQYDIREKYDLFITDENNERSGVDYKKQGHLLGEIINKLDESIIYPLLTDMKWLSYQVAIAYGVPDEPMSDSEKEMWWKLFRYLNRAINDYGVDEQDETNEVIDDKSSSVNKNKNEGEAGFV